MPQAHQIFSSPVTSPIQHTYASCSSSGHSPPPAPPLEVEGEERRQEEGRRGAYPYLLNPRSSCVGSPAHTVSRCPIGGGGAHDVGSGGHGGGGGRVKGEDGGNGGGGCGRTGIVYHLPWRCACTTRYAFAPAGQMIIHVCIHVHLHMHACREYLGMHAE